MSPSDARWLRAYRLTPMPRLRLACFPHAGGSASFFRDWAAHLPADIDLLAVQYPGREERFDEPPSPSLEAMAEAIAPALLDYADAPLALFGHSLGAALAYETARVLERHGVVPLRLFASAHPAPHLQRGGRLHAAPDRALLDDVARLDAGNAVRLADPELRALVLPALRSDYRLIETYRRAPPLPLASPIEVLLPTADREVDRAEAEGWQAATQRPLTLTRVEGGHFYLIEQRQPLLEHLGRCLSPSLSREVA
ncbi:thioesterase II family protein [Pseudomonas mangiferae]|uniref:Thioesterase n=1 Tax=Pseudomonas mangiferae TaxID=2593654 RepID=A0A553GYA3_9PSED|nr:alpha/beta fold hydrolase [Pseudomonas mangiferae]TRX74491.1 thioesterase [Pseudomonas mangiferae]